MATLYIFTKRTDLEAEDKALEVAELALVRLVDTDPVVLVASVGTP